MLTTTKTFFADESGAVTVDWVVLTAALVGLGVAAMGVVRGGVASLTTEIESGLTTQNIGPDNFDDINLGGDDDGGNDDGDG